MGLILPLSDCTEKDQKDREREKEKEREREAKEREIREREAKEREAKEKEAREAREAKEREAKAQPVLPPAKQTNGGKGAISDRKGTQDGGSPPMPTAIPAVKPPPLAYGAAAAAGLTNSAPVTPQPQTQQPSFGQPPPPTGGQAVPAKAAPISYSSSNALFLLFFRFLFFFPHDF